MANRKQMTAAVLYAPGDLRVERVPVPRPGQGEVLVRVGACGICGSDGPRVLEKGAHRHPLIPGHEFAGTVAELGGGVSRWKAGDRVAVFPLIPCRACPACREGVYELCENYDYLGSRSNGAFAEYVCAPAWNLVRVPEGVSLECAALTEPAAVALHALNRFGVGRGATVAVFGAGPIGVLVAQWAAALGAGRIWLVDIVPEKLDVARELTRAELILAGERDPVEEIGKATEGRGVDLAVEAAGVPATVRQALAVCARGGRVVLLGNPSADVTLPQELVSQVLRKQLVLGGSWNSSFRGGEDDEWAAALAAMADGRLRVAPLITHRFRLEQAGEAFSLIAENARFYQKIMFVFD